MGYLARVPQVLAVVDKTTFRNCLVTMQLNTQKNELPRGFEVASYIHNEYTKYVYEDLEQGNIGENLIIWI